MVYLLLNLFLCLNVVLDIIPQCGALDTVYQCVKLVTVVLEN